MVESCCAISPALSHCALLQVLARVVGVYLIGSFTPMSRIKQFKHLHACRGPRDLQCIIGWDTRVHSSEFEVKESSLTVGHWFNDGWACDYKSPILGTSPYSWRDASEIGEKQPEVEGHRGFLYAVFHDPSETFFPKFDYKKFIAADQPCGVEPVTLHRLRAQDALSELDAPTVESSALTPHTLPIQFSPKHALWIPEMPTHGGLYGQYQPSSSGQFHSLDYPLFYFNIRDNVKERVQAFQNLRDGAQGEF